MKIKNKLAPIILFCYNRPIHLKKTIEALKKNIFSNESILYIYSDGPKNNKDTGVELVRKYINIIDGFKSIKITQSDVNKGLASSIIEGVSEVINKHGRAIILEDDIITSPSFLAYMNDALNYYENQKKIWHISGWNYPISVGESNRSFLWKIMNCWGWATWRDRWSHFNNNAETYINRFSRNDISRFTIDNTVPDFWTQLMMNKQGKIKTWAIFWYATIFTHKGLCLNPNMSFVDNIGFDLLGTHTSPKTDLYNLKGPLCQTKIINFPNTSKENLAAISQVKLFYKFNKLLTSQQQLIIDYNTIRVEHTKIKLELQRVYNSRRWKLITEVAKLKKYIFK